MQNHRPGATALGTDFIPLCGMVSLRLFSAELRGIKLPKAFHHRGTENTEDSVGGNYGTGNFLCELGCKRYRSVEALLRKDGFYTFRRRSNEELANYEEWRPRYRVVSGHVR